MQVKMLPKIQHYVPQFILKNFSAAENSQIYVFDKKKEKVFRTHIKNVAAEKGFYNFDEGDNKFSVEHKLSVLESITAGIIEKIIKHQSLSLITKDEKLSLSIFIAAQFSRTKQQRITIKQVDDHLVNRITQSGGDPNKIIGFAPFSNDADVDKFAIRTLESNIISIYPILYKRGWILFRSTKSLNYYISDNPITMHNDNDFGLMGNLGLVVPGIEIYFPLSPTLSLGIFDESNQEIIHRSYREIRKLSSVQLQSRKISKIKKRGIKELARGLEIGSVVQSEEENVQFHNSMQVKFSSRFLYSNTQNFDMVYEMLQKNPEFKEPLQIIAR